MSRPVIYILIAITMLLLAGSCDLGREPKLSVDRELIEFPVDGGRQELNIRANAEWVATVIPRHFAVSPSSGEGNGVLTVIAPANPSAQTLVGYVTITCRTPETAVAEIVQISVDPSAPEVIIDDWDPGLVPAEGGTVTGFMVTNMNWRMDCDTEGVLVSFSGGSGIIGNHGSFEMRVDVPANPQVSERLIHLTFSRKLVTDQYLNPIPVAVFEIRQAGQGSAEI